MTENDARQALADLLGTPLMPGRGKIQRAIETARQIGSSWPTSHINVIYLGHSKFCEPQDRFRIVIE